MAMRDDVAASRRRTLLCSVCERGLALALDLDVDAVVVEAALQVGELALASSTSPGTSRWKARAWSATGLASRNAGADERRRRIARYTVDDRQRRAECARAARRTTSGLRMSAMTAATMKMSRTVPAARASDPQRDDRQREQRRAGPSAGRRRARRHGRRRGLAARLGSTSRSATVGARRPSPGACRMAERPRDHPLRRRCRRRARAAHAARAAARAPRAPRARRSSSSTARTPRAAWASRRRSPTSSSRPASTSSRSATTPTTGARSSATSTRDKRHPAPGQLPAQPAGPRHCVVERDGVRLGVVNLSGNVFLKRRARGVPGGRRGAARPPRQGRPRPRRLPRGGDEREGRAWAGTSTGG